jgi:Tfp pilus assembly protein PilV
MNREHTDRKKERGLTLVEVLVAFFILFVVTLAVLQLLAMAYLVNLGSMIRTDLSYRAERVVETIRLQRFRVFVVGAAEDPCCPVVGPSAAKTITPTDCQTFWGSDGANVMEAGARHTLSYTINNNTVTVQAEPLKTGNNQYIGPATFKVVIYVAQLQ